MKISSRLIQSGALENREVRHCASWEIHQLPRLRPATPHTGLVNEDLFQRQKVHAPKLRAPRGLQLLLHVLRGR